MKTLLLTLPTFLVLNACSNKEEDTAAADSFADEGADGEEEEEEEEESDVMNSSPGCSGAGALCYSFVGPLWAGQDVEGFCGQISAQYEAEVGTGLSFLNDGCPSGAATACSGILMGADEAGNPVDGSDVTIYFYPSVPEADASSICSQNGGSFETL